MTTDSEDENNRKGGLRPWLLPGGGEDPAKGRQGRERAAGFAAEESPSAARQATDVPAKAGDNVRDNQAHGKTEETGSETGSETEPKKNQPDNGPKDGQSRASVAASGAAAPRPAGAGGKRPGRVLGSLSLLLALVALAGAGYLYYLLIYLNPEADASAQLAVTEQRVAELDSRLSGLASQQQDVLATMREGQKSQEAALAASEAALLTALNDVKRQGPPSAREWQLAEAQYLLRIANHRLLMERDVPSALQLLRAADQILMELDDFSLHGVRARLADEILALGNVEGVDVQGLFLRLEALKGQLDQLPLRLPEYLVDGQAQPDAQRGFLAVLSEEFGKYLQLRRFDGSVKPLLAPEEAVYLELNLRLMLERAQLAALRREQMIYEESLTTAQDWIEAYLDLDEQSVQQMIDELSSLGELTLDRPLPDISGSLNELAAVLRSPS